MDEKIIKISKKSSPRGEDGYKTFSVRVKEETVAALDDLALKYLLGLTDEKRVYPRKKQNYYMSPK